MNEQELDALVKAKLAERLAARLAADRARVREEVIRELRREADRAHHAKINAKHPIETRLAGLTQAEEDARQKAMAERTAATNARMDAANAKPVAGQVARNLRPTAADAAGGGSSFRIKS